MRRKTSIEILFSLSLFTVFVLCSFLILLLQSESYRWIIHQSEALEDRHTPIAYVNAKIRANDGQGAIQEITIKGKQALAIHDFENETITYIYQQDKQLMEVNQLASLKPQLDYGTALFPIQDFHMQKDKGMLTISLTSREGDKETLHVALRSERGASK